MLSLLLAICLLGAGGATSAFSTTNFPVSTKQQEDVILQINQRQDSEDHSEYSDLFEGDIIFPRASTAFSPNIMLWVKKAGIVQIPYILHPSYEPEHIQTINAAFSDFHATTCIRFVNRTDQRDYISIMPGLGCYSGIGRIGKRQIVSLSFGCLTKGKGPTLHEMMHVLGFWHEHSRADRDKYIRINWEAIRKGYTQNFCKYDTTNMIVNYTFGSILHYSETAFADSEGLKTIVPLTKAEIGQREKLHEMDILRINKLYCTEPEEFSPGVRPEMYNCNAESTKQNAETELHTTADSFATIRQESSFISASNYSAAQEPAYTPPFNSSAIQEPGFSSASNSSNNERLEHSPASRSSTSQEPEYIQVPTSFATQESEYSPTANSSSEGLESSPNHNSSATQIPGSFTSVTSKAVSFNFSRLTSAMTGERKKDLIFKLVSTYAPGPEVTQNIYYTNSEIFGGKVSLWPATNKGVKVTLFNTQMTIVQASSSITEKSPIVSSLANTSLKETTKVLVSTSLKANQNVGSTLFFSQERLEGTTTTVQESDNASLILPTMETKSSETAILETLGRPASKISAAPTKMIVPTQNTMEENPDLEKNTLSYISQRIGMPGQSSNDYVWYPGNKAKVNLPHDQKYDHLRIRLIKMLGKGSLPDSRGTNVRFLKERRLKNKSALKSLHKIFYFGRPSAATIKPESFCGFEAGMCGWKQSTGDDLDWKLVWGSVNTYTGHLKEGGFHLSLESHQGKRISGQRAILDMASPLSYSIQATAVIAAIITFLILFTIFGNVLVVIAVLTSRSLKAPQNLFLVSLAAADILVATLIIPFSLANELMGYWYFGKTWCEMYLALDVLFCTSSIVHLCAISLDRYWSVSQAIEYNSKRTPRRIKCIILIVWTLAALISLPPLIYKGKKEDSNKDKPQCKLNEEPWYILSSSICSFFAPCLIMILVYLRIYLIAKRRSMKNTNSSKPKDRTCKLFGHRAGHSVENSPGNACSNPQEKLNSVPPDHLCALKVGNPTTKENNGQPEPGNLKETNGHGPSMMDSVVTARGVVLLHKTTKDCVSALAKKKSHINREKRFTFVLAVVIGVFVLCWFPFFFTYSLQAICPDLCYIPQSVFQFFFWIGYCNSSLNPVIYTIFNQDFRKAFRRILCSHLMHSVW